MNKGAPALKKIVVMGPESSGKSTLCAALAAALGTVWVQEYARTYLEARGQINILHEAELLAIAEGQLAAEDEAALHANGYLICDTDLHMVRIWGETIYNCCHRHILEAIAARKYDSYLLAYPDIPWMPDPLRAYPDIKDRHHFYLQYLDTAQHSGLPFHIIKGTPEQRLVAALKAIAPNL